MNPIEITARLRANADDMVSGFNRAGRAAEQMQGRVTGAGGAMSRVVGVVTMGGMAMATALQGAAMAGATMGLRFSMANEQAIIGFKTLLGSQEEASKMFKELQQFAATTPFEFPQLRDAASKLLTTGIEAERLIPIMTALGDSTAAMGTGAEGIQRAVYALQQMNLVGKITGQDMMQLANAGIPAWDALASQAGMTVQEVKKAVEQGKLQNSVQLLMQGIENYSGAAMGRVRGMMAEQSQTLVGMMSTLKDEVNIALGEMMKPAVGGIKTALPELTKVIKTTFKGMTEPINKLVGTMVQNLQTLLPALNPIASAFSGLMVAALDAVIPLFTEIAMVLPELTPTVKALAQIIGDLADIIGPVVVQLASGLVPIVNAMATAVAWGTGMIADMIDNFEFLQPVLAAVVAGIIAYNAQLKIKAAWEAKDGAVAMARNLYALATSYNVAAIGMDSARVAALGANTAMTATPWGAIIAAIVAVGVGLVMAYQKFEWFRNAVDGVFRWIKDHWEWLVAGFLPVIGVFIVLLVKHMDKVVAAFQWAFDKIVWLWNHSVGWIISTAKSFLSWLGYGVEGELSDMAKKIIAKQKESALIAGKIAAENAEGFKATRAEVKELQKMKNELNKMRRDKKKDAKEDKTGGGGLTPAKSKKGATNAIAQIEEAKALLDDMRQRAADLRSRTSAAITSVLSFGDAMRRVEEERQQYGRARKGAFLDALKRQYEQGKRFAELIVKLREAGLGEAGISQVLQAGAEQGSQIATELLKGGTDAISNANAWYAELKKIGDDTGLKLADSFYSEGITAGEALVKGVEEAVKKLKLKISSKGLTDAQLAKLKKNFGIDLEFSMQSLRAAATPMAAGGIVKARTGGTLALLGEAGRDEAVIPLPRSGAATGGIYNITVQAGVGDPVAIGREVVSALQALQRRTGTIDIRTR